MKAIILAAGKGTRLQPLTLETPKSLLEVQGVPILEYILNELPDSIDEVIIVTDYLQQKILDFINSKTHRFSIQLVPQIQNEFGTMAALKSVKPFLREGEKFLVLNGDDLIIKSDLEKILQHERSFGVFKTSILPRYYKVVEKDGLLDSFQSQTDQEKNAGVPIATGTYLLDTQIFNFETRLLSGGEIGIPQTLVDNKDSYPVNIIHFESWRPINSIADLEKENSIEK